MCRLQTLWAEISISNSYVCRLVQAGRQRKIEERESDSGNLYIEKSKLILSFPYFSLLFSLSKNGADHDAGGAVRGDQLLRVESAILLI